jgi:hypothetical protein
MITNWYHIINSAVDNNLETIKWIYSLPNVSNLISYDNWFNILYLVTICSKPIKIDMAEWICNTIKINIRHNNDKIFKTNIIWNNHEILLWLTHFCDNYIWTNETGYIIITDEEVIKLKMKKAKEIINVYKEELLIKTWEPKRLFNWCLSLDDIN